MHSHSPIVTLRSDGEFPLSARHPPFLVPHTVHLTHQRAVMMGPSYGRMDPSEHTSHPHSAVLTG